MVERNNTDAQLIKELERLKPHDHLCLIHETHQEWEEAIIPFIRIGLERKEKCIYVADTRTAEELRNYLSKAGIAAAFFEESGQLTILRESDVYTKEDSFDPDRIIRLLITETEKAVSQGYPALRVTGEMTFVLKGVTGSERLLEYETKLNRDLFPKYPCLAICQYDRWKFDSEIIKGIIMTHPKLIHGNRVSPNFYYIPTEEFLNHKRAEMEAQHWLNNIAREQKRKEELEESEVRYRRLFEAAKDGILILNAKSGIIMDINPYLLNLMGYSKQEILGKRLWELGFFKDRLRSHDSFRELQQKGYIHYEDLPLETKDGRKLDVEFVSNSYLVNSEMVIQCNIRDITERKSKNEEIQHLNLTLRAIRDVNQLIVREKSRKRLLNELCRILIRTGSYSVAWIALLDQSGKVVVHAQAGLSKKFTPMFKQMKAGELPPYGQQALGQTSAVVTKEPGSACGDGSLSGELKNVRTALTVRLEHAGRIYGLLSAHMPSASVTDEEIVLFQEAASDMAFALHGIKLLEEKRRAMRSLKEAEAIFQDLYDNAPIAYLSMDTTGHIIKANKAACNWLGYSLKELSGIDRSAIFAGESQDRARILFERFKKGDPVEDEELIYIRKDGQKVYGLLSFSAIRDDNGCIIASRTVIKDITDRKQAEESLRDSENKFRHVSSITSDIAYSCLSKQGAAYSFDWLSGATKRITGYKIGEIKAQSCWRSLVIDEDIPLFEKNVIGLRPGQTSSCELRLRHKNGEIVWVASYAQCVTDTKSPECLRLYGGLVDITKRVLTEAKISQQNRELKYFASQVPGMLYQFKRMPDGTYSVPFSNDAIKGIFGCTPEDVKESFAPVAKVIVPEDIKRVTDSIEQSAREMTPWECEYRVKLPGKGIRTLWGHSVPEAQTDGSIVWYGFNTDITDRKQAEETIKQSEAKYSSLVENSNDGIIIIENGILRFINTKMSEMTGFVPEKAVGRKFVDFSPPEEKAILMERHLRRMSGEKIPETYEATIVSRDGHHIFVEVHASNTVYQGHPVVIAIIRDITERKQAERKILLNTRHVQSLLELYRMSEDETKSISDYMDCMLEASQISLQSHFAFIGMMNADESVMTI
ncbi:MAG: PAS domain S-box protein, partial [Dehalococcoidales bacterium]|nr:PAS domain S-box protein [Dehalococcoidales bacterium]